MRLITSTEAGDVSLEMSVWHPKVGRRFERMELDGTDFEKLSRMGSEQLARWFQDWRLGFTT